MRVLNKILIVVWILIMLVLSALVIAGLWFPQVSNVVLDHINTALKVYWPTKIVTTAIAAVVLILSLEIIIAACVPEKQKRIRLASGEKGSVQVTVDTVNQMALKAVRSCEGVKDATVVTKNGKQGLIFKTVLTIHSSTVIAQVTERVQETVRTEIETITGMQVAEVTVFIDNNLKTKSK